MHRSPASHLFAVDVEAHNAARKEALAERVARVQERMRQSEALGGGETADERKKSTPLLIMSVDIGGGQSDNITVYHGDEAEELAREFCSRNGLSFKFVPTISSHIEKNVQLWHDKQAQAQARVRAAERQDPAPVDERAATEAPMDEGSAAEAPKQQLEEPAAEWARRAEEAEATPAPGPMPPPEHTPPPLNAEWVQEEEEEAPSSLAGKQPGAFRQAWEAEEGPASARGSVGGGGEGAPKPKRSKSAGPSRPRGRRRKRGSRRGGKRAGPGVFDRLFQHATARQARREEAVAQRHEELAAGSAAPNGLDAGRAPGGGQGRSTERGRGPRRLSVAEAESTGLRLYMTGLHMKRQLEEYAKRSKEKKEEEEPWVCPRCGATNAYADASCSKTVGNRPCNTPKPQPFRPTISHYARSLKRTAPVHEMLSAPSKDEGGQQSIAEELEEKRMAECHFKPRINQRSSRIASRRRTEAHSEAPLGPGAPHAPPAAIGPVTAESSVRGPAGTYEKLYEDAEQRRMRQDESQFYSASQYSFQPNLGATRRREAQDRNPGEFYQRLHTSGQLREQRLAEERARLAREDGEGNPLFRPHTGRAPNFARNANAMPIGEFLYASRHETADARSRLSHRQSDGVGARSTYTNSTSERLLRQSRHRKFVQMFLLLLNEQRGGEEADAVVALGGTVGTLGTYKDGKTWHARVFGAEAGGGRAVGQEGEGAAGAGAGVEDGGEAASAGDAAPWPEEEGANAEPQESPMAAGGGNDGRATVETAEVSLMDLAEILETDTSSAMLRRAEEAIAERLLDSSKAGSCAIIHPRLAHVVEEALGSQKGKWVNVREFVGLLEQAFTQPGRDGPRSYLLANIRSKQATVGSALDREREATHTFRPRVDRTSAEMARHKGRGRDPIYEILHREGKQYRERVERQRKEKEAKDMEGCTFRPRIHKDSQLFKDIYDKLPNSPPRAAGLTTAASSTSSPAAGGGSPVRHGAIRRAGDARSTGKAGRAGAPSTARSAADADQRTVSAPGARIAKARSGATLRGGGRHGAQRSGASSTRGPTQQQQLLQPPSPPSQQQQQQQQQQQSASPRGQSARSAADALAAATPMEADAPPPSPSAYAAPPPGFDDSSFAAAYDEARAVLAEAERVVQMSQQQFGRAQ